MALIVEDGSAVPGAESYASINAADSRNVLRGVADWAELATEKKEQALRTATDFMLTNYRTRWAGRRRTREQALCWPRYDVVVDLWPVPSDIVPVDVVNACIDLAVRSGNGEKLMPDLDIGSNVLKKTKVGPIEDEFFQNTTDARERFVAVDASLAVYFGAAGGSNSIKLVRA
jgi:hypothetical protein